MPTAFEQWLEKHRFYLYAPGYQTKELAAYLGVTRRTVEHWMKGQGKPSDQAQERIKIYLDKIADSDRIKE